MITQVVRFYWKYTGCKYFTYINHFAYLPLEFSITTKHGDSKRSLSWHPKFRFGSEGYRDIGISTFPFVALHSATTHICGTKRANNPACVMSLRSFFLFAVFLQPFALPRRNRSAPFNGNSSLKYARAHLYVRDAASK